MTPSPDPKTPPDEAAEAKLARFREAAKKARDARPQGDKDLERASKLYGKKE